MQNGSKERVVKVWRVSDASSVASLTLRNPTAYRWFLGGLSFSPNGSTLAVLPYLRHPVVLWNFIEKTQQTIPFPLLHGNSIAQLKYSADGKLLGLVAGKNSYMLDPTTRKVRYPMELHKGNVTDLTFSPEGRWFATTSSGDGIVRVWDTQTGKLRGTLMSDHSESLARVVFHPNGKSLAYISSRGQLAYWQCPQ